MSNNIEFKEGDRVSVTLFQHKGKVGTVRFFGARKKIFGKWVGIELDDPCAEGLNGTLNDEKLFECMNGHGLVLRNT